MKPLNKFPKSFFEKYKEKPVRLNEYHQGMTDLANKYIKKISSEYNLEVCVIGSVAYKIPTTEV